MAVALRHLRGPGSRAVVMLNGSSAEGGDVIALKKLIVVGERGDSSASDVELEIEITGCKFTNEASGSMASRFQKLGAPAATLPPACSPTMCHFDQRGRGRSV